MLSRRLKWQQQQANQARQGEAAAMTCRISGTADAGFDTKGTRLSQIPFRSPDKRDASSRNRTNLAVEDVET